MERQIQIDTQQKHTYRETENMYSRKRDRRLRVGDKLQVRTGRYSAQTEGKHSEHTVGKAMDANMTAYADRQQTQIGE
jgi:hypothetical protein